MNLLETLFNKFHIMSPRFFNKAWQTVMIQSLRNY